MSALGKQHYVIVGATGDRARMVILRIWQSSALVLNKSFLLASTSLK